MSTDSDSDSSSNSCKAPDSDGEVAEDIAIVAFERKMDTAEDIVDGIGDRYESIDILEYHGDVFEEHWGEYDCFVGLMASGIAMRKTAHLLDASMGAVPAMTTASEAAGKQGVEKQAKALDAHVVNGDSTVATNLAVLDDELGPIERLDGPKAVLVDDDVSVLKRNGDDGVVLGCGSVAGADTEQFHAAWDTALEAAGLERSDVEFVATGTRKADEEGLLAAAEAWGLGVVAFEKETLEGFEGPTPSRSKELIGWPGIAEASALAAGRDHELLAKKTRYDEAVTVAIGR
ncbi:cobalt-precorrin 5A hydrolase [Halobacteriales archaeon QH_8_67_36]|nr:MAG: cobalt-precorrin 5A hydrolase [Halobacteriales archaeon QH_8_67_36]